MSRVAFDWRLGFVLVRAAHDAGTRGSRFSSPFLFFSFQRRGSTVVFFFSGAVSSLHKSARRQVTATLRTQLVVDHDLESFPVSAPGIWYAGV